MHPRPCVPRTAPARAPTGRAAENTRLSEFTHHSCDLEQRRRCYSSAPSVSEVPRATLAATTITKLVLCPMDPVKTAAPGTTHKAVSRLVHNTITLPCRTVGSAFAAMTLRQRRSTGKSHQTAARMEFLGATASMVKGPSACHHCRRLRRFRFRSLRHVRHLRRRHRLCRRRPRRSSSLPLEYRLRRRRFERDYLPMQLPLARCGIRASCNMGPAAPPTSEQRHSTHFLRAVRVGSYIGGVTIAAVITRTFIIGARRHFKISMPTPTWSPAGAKRTTRFTTTLRCTRHMLTPRRRLANGNFATIMTAATPLRRSAIVALQFKRPFNGSRT